MQRLGNHDDGYGPVTKVLHWLTVLALVAHLGLVLKHQMVDRDRLLYRMT